MKTIQLIIDDELLVRVNYAIKQSRTTRVEFFRDSLIYYLEKLRINELEKRQREGYQKKPVQTGEFDVWENEQVWETE